MINKNIMLWKRRKYLDLPKKVKDLDIETCTALPKYIKEDTNKYTPVFVEPEINTVQISVLPIRNLQTQCNS